jgi:hypothetical protein
MTNAEDARPWQTRVGFSRDIDARLEDASRLNGVGMLEAAGGILVVILALGLLVAVVDAFAVSERKHRNLPDRLLPQEPQGTTTRGRGTEVDVELVNSKLASQQNARDAFATRLLR